ncbi:hypothetical protein [Streptomyces enissocaesilis]|uniref:Uncharacterized protein n=1 Tax=Streptomyces enissocaesilis TaxID=332589 RepID=A0ABN3X2S1_9ACTN
MGVPSGLLISGGPKAVLQEFLEHQMFQVFQVFQVFGTNRDTPVRAGRATARRQA